MSQRIQHEEAYRSYLLRCWQEGTPDSEASQTWRFALTRVGTEDPRLGFTTLWDVFTYLDKQLSAPMRTATEMPAPGRARYGHDIEYSLDQG